MKKMLISGVYNYQTPGGVWYYDCKFTVVCQPDELADAIRAAYLSGDESYAIHAQVTFVHSD